MFLVKCWVDVREMGLMNLFTYVRVRLILLGKFIKILSYCTTCSTGKLSTVRLCTTVLRDRRNEYWDHNLIGITIHEKVENPVLQIEVFKIFGFRLDMNKLIKHYQIYSFPSNLKFVKDHYKNIKINF